MRVRRSQAELLYERIQNDVRTNRHRLLILPARGVDALCACKMLQAILVTDSIPHQVTPVSGFSDIVNCVHDFVESQESPVSIVLVGCGANIDLTEFLGLQDAARDHVTVYVIDSHRPLHLSNIDQSNKRVRVLMEEVDESTDFPDPLPADIGDFIDFAEDEDDDDEAEEDDYSYGFDDDDEPDDGDIAVTESKRNVDGRDGSAVDDDDSYDVGQEYNDVYDNSDGDVHEHKSNSPLGVKRERSSKNKERKVSRNGEGSKLSSRHRVRLNKREKHELRLQRREEYKALIQLQKKYYEKASFAPPVACLTFHMAHQLSQDTNNMLWWAILGLTDNYILERITQETYSEIVTVLYAAMNQFNDDLSSSDAARLSLTERQENDELIQITKRGHISFSQELKLYLLRHWSIYNSMYHSREIATTLKTWTAKGESDLKIILAKMGIPLSEAERPYAVLDEHYKTALIRGVESFGEMEGLEVLENLKYESFVRQHASSFTTSAADAVLGLNAILDASPTALDTLLAVKQAASLSAGASSTGTSAASSSLDAYLSSTGESSVGVTAISTTEASSSGASLTPRAAENPEQVAALQLATAQRLKQQFWLASDSLDSRSVDVLRRGIELQIQTLRAVVNQGVAMYKKGDIDTRSYVHLAVIDSAPDIDWFKQPGALARLVFFLQDLVSKHRPSRPMLGAVLMQGTGEYLIVGANAIRGGITRQGANSFGAAFRYAAERIGVAVRHEGFETSTLQLPKDSLQPFFRQLIIVVSGYISLTAV